MLILSFWHFLGLYGKSGCFSSAHWEVAWLWSSHLTTLSLSVFLAVGLHLSSRTYIFPSTIIMYKLACFHLSILNMWRAEICAIQYLHSLFSNVSYVTNQKIVTGLVWDGMMMLKLIVKLWFYYNNCIHTHACTHKLTNTHSRFCCLKGIVWSIWLTVLKWALR